MQATPQGWVSSVDWLLAISLQRKKTLLVEYKQRNKANQFIDRRFGEYNDELSVEEKMMQRFTLERKVCASMLHVTVNSIQCDQLYCQVRHCLYVEEAFCCCC